VSRRPIRSRTSASARARRRRRWLRFAAVAVALPLVVLSAATGYYGITFSRQIDARLHGERERVLPRVFGRPLELRRGQALGERDLVDRLNDLGYAQRARLDRPGEFVIEPGSVSLLPRDGAHAGQPVRVVFEQPRAPGTRLLRIRNLEAGGAPIDAATLDAPVLTALIRTGREKRRRVPLAAIPSRVVQAVIAIEDRRFYDHPGVDPVRMVGALVTNLRGERRYLEGASTLTQQLVKNFFLTPEKSLRRKLLEQFMAVILERRLSKDEILELYLNEVYLGQRGSFAIHGVAEASRLFFARTSATSRSPRRRRSPA
jgi:penicillin-binding protein 1B